MDTIATTEEMLGAVMKRTICLAFVSIFQATPGLASDTEFKKQRAVDMARCELEAWQVTGHPIHFTDQEGTYRTWMDAFRYHQICMKEKGYRLLDEDSALVMNGYCESLAREICWQR